MRILLLTEFFPKSERAEITGGIEARCFYVSRHLRRENAVTVLAALTGGEKWEHASLNSFPRRLVFVLRMLAAGLISRFDVVEGTNQLVHPIAWVIGRVRRKPVVFWYADVLLGEWRTLGSAGWLGEIVERVSLRLRADHYIPISQHVAEKLQRRRIPLDRMTVIPCGVDEDLIDRIRTETTRTGTTTISAVARMLRYKGLHLVIEATAELVRRGFDIRLSIVGQGPESARLQKLASDLGITDRVTLHGHLAAHADVLRIVAGSHIFVSASTVEGFGIALAEAMALGVPYVATDMPTYREVTGDGVGGLLFAAGDSADLAGKVQRLLEDPELYRRSAQAGREWSARYRWSDIALQTQAVYQRLVPQRADGRKR